MKCSVLQKDFIEGLLEAQRFVAGKGFASPLLNGIYLEVTKNSTLIIRSSSGLVLYQKELPCKDSEPGACVLPTNLLVSSVKSLNSGELQLSLEQDQLIISQGQTHFTLASLPGTEFPEIELQNLTAKMILPVEKFLSAARKVLVAASADETKPVLTSVLLEMRQPNALVATDGFRLFRMESDISLDQSGGILLPAKILRDLLGILEKKTLSTLECLTDDSRQSLLFQLGDSMVKMAAVAGDFPPYQNIIPQACSFSYAVEREVLLQAVKQAMIFAKEYSGIVVLEVQDGKLLLSSQASSSGRTRSFLPISQPEGEPVRFAVNGRYLVEFLSSIDSLEVVIQGTESLRPVLFRVPDDASLLYLIMPFKLQE